MWEVFERLCKEKGVTPYRVGEETGIKSSTFYGWKTGKYTPVAKHGFMRCFMHCVPFLTINLPLFLPQILP